MHGTAHSVQDDLSPPSLRTLSVTNKILITTVGYTSVLQRRPCSHTRLASLSSTPLYTALLSLLTIPVLRTALTFTVVTQAISRCCRIFVNLNVFSDAGLIFSTICRYVNVSFCHLCVYLTP